MKVFLSLTGIILTAFSLKAQDTKTSIQANITPVTIAVGFEHTTHLIFPYAIKSVDRGNAEVLVQKAKGVENVLRVKAGVEGFTATNLTVITGEGALYSFLLRYQPFPEQLTHRIAERSLPPERMALLSDGGNEANLMNTAKKIAAIQRFRSRPKAKTHESAMALHGIYIRDQTLYLQLFLENGSNIDYDVDQFRIHIRDRKVTKRTASQETELEPLYVEGNIERIAGRSGQVIVVALEKFTIPDKKLLVIQLLERSGGRHLSIKLKNRHIVKARTI